MTPKILCISLGSIGRRHLRNARKLLPGAKIAVWRQHTKGDARVPEGADAMLKSLEEAVAFAPDAVIVSSPATEHLANASAFLDRQVPIFLEKPLAASSDGVEAFAARCRASKGFIMVGYVLRFLPALHAMKRRIADGTLGDVYTGHIQVGQWLPDWRPDADYRTGVSAQAKLGGGALLELSHEIDYTTWLFGWPRSLLCSTAKLSPLEIDVEDSAQLLLEYADKRILVQLDFLQRVATMAVQLVGSKGTLYADLVKEELRLVTPEAPGGKPVDAEKLPNGNDLYLRQFDFFFQQALSGCYNASYPGSQGFSDWAGVDHAAGVLQLVDLARKASDTGARQRVSVGKTS